MRQGEGVETNEKINGQSLMWIRERALLVPTWGMCTKHEFLFRGPNAVNGRYEIENSMVCNITLFEIMRRKVVLPLFLG